MHAALLYKLLFSTPKIFPSLIIHHYILYVSFAVTAFAFNISIEDNPLVFANIPLSWTRNEGDTNSFWFDEYQLASDGSASKVLSVQVDGTSSLNGTMSSVFIRTGAHFIQAIDGNTNSAFFNSTPVTAVAASTSSCTLGSVTATVTASSSSSDGGLNSALSHDNSSVIIGATIGTIVPLTMIVAFIVVICFQRRSKSRQLEDSSESGSPRTPTRTPTALSSAITYFTGPRNPNETITPFVAIPEQHTRPKVSPAIINRPAPQNTNSPGTNSSFFAQPPASSVREKIFPPRSVNTPISPVTKHAVHDTMAEQTLSSQSLVSIPADTHLARLTTALPPLTQRQQLLEEEAGRLRLQIMSMVNSALSRSDQGPTAQNFQSENHQMADEMERMRTQIEMLEQDRDSSWARGLSDEPPSYIASIGR
ncbi:hypothetical protein F5876DRAFT_80448 [Lentinula aff. lateritia]|uniref:Uncharacterized protein n=1 Tax=Lentinula aff. lateritia TaxID=2804960 RepID=A0ACC1TQ08_9AGAR|nr:hypothetical protein F5876DRAFT_80448 [Lentinula aff. lateritia]